MYFYSAPARRNHNDQVRHMEVRPKPDRHRRDYESCGDERDDLVMQRKRTQ